MSQKREREWKVIYIQRTSAKNIWFIERLHQGNPKEYNTKLKKWNEIELMSKNDTNG